MRLFHKTRREYRESILRDGFWDVEGFYGTYGLSDQKFNGVRMLDDPIGWPPSRDGNDDLFTIEIPEDIISEHEWIEDGSPYREFLAPASLINSFGPPAVIETNFWPDILDAIPDDF